MPRVRKYYRPRVASTLGDFEPITAATLTATTTDGWIGTGRHQTFIPSGYTPNVRTPLYIFVDGAGNRGSSASFLASNTLGVAINANKSGFSGLNNPNGVSAWSGATAYVVGDIVTSGGSTYTCITAHTNHVPPNASYWHLVVAPIICIPQFCAGPDPVGWRYARNFFWWSIRDVCARYNIDRERMCFLGYSAGCEQTGMMAFRFPKLFAALGMWDGYPNGFSLSQADSSSPDANSDLLPWSTWSITSPADNTHEDDAYARWCAAVGNIPINYQHGAKDTLAYPLGTNNPGTGNSNNDFTVRRNDPVTNPPTYSATSNVASAFNVALGVAGQTQFTTVAATTHPSPAYVTTNRRIYVPYSSYDHGQIASGAVTFGLTNPIWKWLASRTRGEY